MRFIADLHIHSRFSMATASDLNLENLYISARRKGITVIGTGDFTHPEWFAEMKDRLVPAEDGLYRLRPDLEEACDRLLPESCRGDVRFMLQAEVSSIYKKDGRVRKNHSLLYFPSLESVGRFNSRLSAIGNIKSDGRPILGLDSRDLLEILLETDEMGFLVPAHIWTPWFSLLGSKSGFDSIDECFGDLSPYIFAAETGLSSDPAMNWRVSFLDRITLISNSDAHSPGKLGREANLFDTNLSYPSIRSALETGDNSGFIGTLEFFPEEGKYHMDGHRKCGVMLNPCESMKSGGICPECGSKMTLGVLYRVEELADRTSGLRPEKAKPFTSIIPLTEIISEIYQVGSGSKKVASAYKKITEILGPELDILSSMDTEKIKSADIPLLGLAIEKMRSHDIVLSPGYDGEFGTVKIFTDEERRVASGQKLFFDIKEAEKKKPIKDRQEKKSLVKASPVKSVSSGKQINSDPEISDLNAEQALAVRIKPCHMIITAGPGTGKTRTITQRIAHLMNEAEVSSSQIAAITFTNRAAEEMRHRLINLMPGIALPFTGTFHSLCFAILKETFPEKLFCIIDQRERDLLIASVIESLKAEDNKLGKGEVSEFISLRKQWVPGPNLLEHEPEKKEILSKAYDIYQDALDSKNLLDFDDLMFRCLSLFSENSSVLEKYHNRLKFVFIDEYQDLNLIQYHFIRLLCGSGCHVCAIGDPDQSIYGFRGGSSEYFERFAEDFKGAEKLSLIKNYRSSKTILDASFQMIRKGGKEGGERVFSEIDGTKSISIIKGVDEHREASQIVAEIERLVGGTSHYSMYSGKSDGENPFSYAFSDFAVLYRTRGQAEVIMSAFERAGIPFQYVNRESFWAYPGIREAVAGIRLSLGLGGSHDACFDLFPESARKNITESFSSGGISSALVSARACLEEKGFFMEMDVFSAWQRLMEMSRHYGNDAGLFLSDLALMTDQDTFREKSQKVSLMTLHASKGLEFPVVFISGCEKDLLPYHRKGAEVCVDEERRLFFVGMTRAKEMLYLSFAETRTVFGQKMERVKSPFLNDIEEKLLEYSRSGLRSAKKESPGKQMELF